MKKTELRQAYVWTCDECGHDNFVRAVVLEFDEETATELKEDHGIEIWEEGDWVTIPDVVDCKFCNEVYKTLDYRISDDQMA